MGKIKPTHWAAQQEKGNPFVLRLSIWLVRYLPGAILPPVVALISGYYYLTGAKIRRHIADYQSRLLRAYPEIRLPKAAVYRQIYAFAQAIADRFAVWQGRLGYQDLRIEDPDNIYQRMDSPPAGARGEILVCAHHGNMEVCRALVSHHRGFVLNVLVHSKHAVAFNQALKQAGADDIRLIQVSELDAALMLSLQQRIERGEWLAIAADRIPVRGDKVLAVPFLGTPALFAQGPWLLAGLLQARVNTLFCCKIAGRYRLRLANFAPALRWQKHNREAVIAQSVARYAERLEQECRLAPLQWFNFYDFWQTNSKKPGQTDNQ